MIFRSASAFAAATRTERSSALSRSISTRSAPVAFDEASALSTAANDALIGVLQHHRQARKTLRRRKRAERGGDRHAHRPVPVGIEARQG